MENLQNKNCTFNQILEMWLEEKRGDVKIQSCQRYESLIDSFIKDTLGTIKCSEIQKDEIIELFKREEISKMSISVRKSVFGIIKSALEIAYSLNYCSYIDLRKIKFRGAKNNIIVFTTREQRKIDSYLIEELNVRKLVLLMCMYTGMRVGEASGLKWKDIDFSKKSVNINKTIQRIKNPDSNSERKTILIASTPKSESSSRVIPLPDFLMPLLKKLKSEDNYYILSGSKKLYDPRLLESFYERTLKKCDIEHLKFHTLRHTFATRSIESGMDPKTLSEILGHSSVEITLKLYVHPSYDMKKKSIEKVTKFVKRTVYV